MGWLSGWAKRIKLTIDKDDIDAGLSDFPVLVYISAASGIGNVNASCVFDELRLDINRKKIAVTTSDGYTQCYVEIERWDGANEKAWLWVKVPSVASGADTELYLYYDKDHADNDTYVGDTNSTPAENVWDANFKAVYHMKDGVDNEHIYDSTDNNNDGTKGAAGEPNEVDGKVGKALDFDGINDLVTILDHPTLDIEDNITLEILIKPSTDLLKANDHASALFITKGADAYFFYWGGGVGTGAVSLFSSGITPNEFKLDQDLFADTWYHIAATFNSTTKYRALYVNKELLGGETVISGNFDVNATDVLIGSPGAYPIPGLVDEVRISDIDRSAAWIKATKESLWDDLLAFGSEELAPLPARKYLIELRDSDGALVSVLDNAHTMIYTEVTNEAPTLVFNLPADDAKATGLTRANEVWLRNYKTGVVVRKFRLNLRRDTR